MNLEKKDNTIVDKDTGKILLQFDNANFIFRDNVVKTSTEFYILINKKFELVKDCSTIQKQFSISEKNLFIRASLNTAIDKFYFSTPDGFIYFTEIDTIKEYISVHFLDFSENLVIFEAKKTSSLYSLDLKKFIFKNEKFKIRNVIKGSKFKNYTICKLERSNLYNIITDKGRPLLSKDYDRIDTIFSNDNLTCVQLSVADDDTTLLYDIKNEKEILTPNKIYNVIRKGIEDKYLTCSEYTLGDTYSQNGAVYKDDLTKLFDFDFFAQIENVLIVEKDGLTTFYYKDFDNKVRDEKVSVNSVLELETNNAFIYFTSNDKMYLCDMNGIKIIETPISECFPINGGYFVTDYETSKITFFSGANTVISIKSLSLPIEDFKRVICEAILTKDEIFELIKTTYSLASDKKALDNIFTQQLITEEEYEEIKKLVPFLTFKKTLPKKDLKNLAGKVKRKKMRPFAENRELFNTELFKLWSEE